jgi:hypothetical protein
MTNALEIGFSPPVLVILEDRDVIFLGAFAKLRKTTINFVLSVCLPACLSVRPPARPSVRCRGTTRLPLDGFS